MIFSLHFSVHLYLIHILNHYVYLVNINLCFDIKAFRVKIFNCNLIAKYFDVWLLVNVINITITM